jgi:hypothetical protein
MKNNIKSLICATAILAGASAAQAVSTDALRYSIDNGASWTVVNDVANLNFISVSIVGGGFNITVNATGFRAGTAASPFMDLGLTGRTSGSGTLIVEYSDIGFTPVSSGAYFTSFQASGGVTTSERTILGANTLFAGADAPISGGIGPIGPFIGPNQNGTSSSHAPGGLTAPYSITIVEVLTSTGAGLGISQDAQVTVPDGGNTLVLLGSALSVLGLGAFRRKAALVA